jgi:hypothetical protein
MAIYISDEGGKITGFTLNAGRVNNFHFAEQ